LVQPLLASSVAEWTWHWTWS